MTSHFDESIITGTLAISGSPAMRLRNFFIAAAESSIASSMLTSIICAPLATCWRAISTPSGCARMRRKSSVPISNGERVDHSSPSARTTSGIPASASQSWVCPASIRRPISTSWAALARGAAYSLEIRVSLDDTDPEKNDRVRGAGVFDKALSAVQLLHQYGLLPIVTATEITSHEHARGRGMYERFRDFLIARGIEKPRVKIMPVFALGRSSRDGGRRLTEEDLEGFDRGTLQCSESRVVADGGVYACPILAGLPGAKLSDGSLEASFRDAPLYHPTCVTCHETGMTCKNG